MNYLLLGRLPETGRGEYHTADGLWTLEVTDHAGGRLLERNPDADPADLIHAAHRDLLRVSTAALAPHALDPYHMFLLPAGPGWWVCQMLHAKDMSRDNALGMHARARSWLGADMAVDEQMIVAPGEPGQQAGQNYLLPAPLHRLVSRPLPDGRVEVHVETWQ